MNSGQVFSFDWLCDLKQVICQPWASVSSPIKWGKWGRLVCWPDMKAMVERAL